MKNTDQATGSNQPETSSNPNDYTYYNGTEPKEVASFKRSANYLKFKQEYEHAIQLIIDFYKQNAPNQGKDPIQLEGKEGEKATVEFLFNGFKKKLFGKNVDPGYLHSQYKTKINIEKIALSLIEITPIPKGTKLDEVQELARKVKFCGIGVYSYAMDTQLKLGGYAGELSDNFSACKDKIARAVITEFIRARIGSDSVHIFNRYWDHFAPTFGSDPIKDTLTEKMVISEENNQLCQNALQRALTPYSITAQLATEHLDNLRNFIGDTVEWKQINEVLSNLKSSYQEIKFDSFAEKLPDTEDQYQLRQDPLWLQVDIAQKISSFPPEITWLNWETIEVEGKRLKRIGNLFWQEVENKVSQPTIADLVKYVDKVAYQQLIYNIEKIATTEPLLSHIAPKYLQASNTKDIALFFSKIGIEASINYAALHFDWFNRLSFNPLIDIILTADPAETTLAEINPALLGQMRRTELQQFFSKLGIQASINYAALHFDWFNRLSFNPLIDIILTADPAETTLAEINPALLGQIKRTELQQFFSKLGIEASINYAALHFDWFNRLSFNPLIDIILTADPAETTLAEINPALLGQIKRTELQQFFSKLGIEASINYATRHLGWFNRLSFNPLIDVILTADPAETTLAEIPPALLVKTTLLERQQFFSKWGARNGLDYIIRHPDWFNGLASKEALFHTLSLYPDSTLPSNINSDVLHSMTLSDISDFFKYWQSMDIKFGPNLLLIIYQQIRRAANKADDFNKDSPNIMDRLLTEAGTEDQVPSVKESESYADVLGQLLIHAIDAKNEDMASRLLQKQNIHLTQNFFGTSRNPLVAALDANLNSVVSQLLSKHDWPAYQPSDKHSLLYYPIKHKNLKILRLLLQLEVDPNEKNLQPDTPSILLSAVLSEDPAMVEELLKFQVRDDSAEALMRAILQGNDNMVQQLASIRRDSDRLDDIYNEALSEAEALNGANKEAIVTILKNNERFLKQKAGQFEFVMQSRHLRERAAVPGKRIGSSYQAILDALDKLQASSGTEQITAAFSLKILIARYNTAERQDLRRWNALQRLDKQINTTLFTTQMRPSDMKKITNFAKDNLSLVVECYQWVSGLSQTFQSDAMTFLIDKLSSSANTAASFAEIKRVYDASLHYPTSKVTLWDSQYAGAAREALNQRFSEQKNVDAEKKLLLGYKDEAQYKSSLQYILRSLTRLKAEDDTKIYLWLDKSTSFSSHEIAFFMRGAETLSKEKLDTTLGRLCLRARNLGIKLVFLEPISQSESELQKSDVNEREVVKLLKNKKFIALYPQSYLLSSKSETSFLPGIALRLGLPALEILSTEKLQVLDDIPSRLGIPVNNGDSSQFDTQVIIQFGNDSITADAAKNLADKHPHSLLFNREGEGHYHPSPKNKTVHIGGDNLRVQVVAHSQIDDTGAMTLGGKTPQAFAQEMKHFFVSKGFEPKHIVLASCSLGSLSPDSTRSFAEQFTQSFDLTNVSVTAYLHDIGINGQGRKFFLDDQGKVDTTRREKIIYHKNQDGRVTHEIVADLPTKVRWTNELLNKLATGRTVQSLDRVSHTLLTDAFHLPDGQLDQQKLLLSAHSPEKRQAWNKAIRQLLQDPATYNEQANLSVQAALAQQQHSIQQQQQRSREFFQAGEKTQKAHPTVEINAHLIPPWYSLREGIDTRRDSDAWSLAFLEAKQAGKTQYDIFSAGLAADAVRRVRIVEETASGGELADSYHLHSQFEQLKNSAALSVDNPTIFTRHNGQDLFGATPAPGAYLLKGKYHSVALHIHQDESAGYRYSLYDPQVGSFDLTALSTGENCPALHSLLDSYLQGKDSAGQTRAQQYGIEKTSTGYAFDAYRVNIEQARALTPLGELQTLLNNQVATRNLLSSVTLDGVTLSAKILLDMGATFEGKPTTLEHLISAEGTSLKKLSFQPQQLHDFLTKNNFNDPALEPSLRLLRKRIDGAAGDSSPLLARGLLQDQQISGKTLSLLKQLSAHTRVNADGTLTVKPTLMAALQPKGLMHRVNQVTGYAGSGMSVLGYYLGYKAIVGYEEALRQQGLTPEKRQALEFERNLALFTVNTNFAVDIGQYGLSRMASSMSGSAAKLGGNMATKARLIKVGGGLLSLVGVAIDLNDARRSFSQLLTETDPKARQDLIVSGSLSVANAIVGLGVATAFFIGGAAAAAAGPLGLIVGGVLLLVGLGYAAARQVEEIEKHIYLTVGEKWDTGWRVFWGNHPAKAIQDKMAETQRSTYREMCDEFLIENARQMVRKQGITPIYHYVYSSKDFDLEAREYWEFKLPPFSRMRKEYVSRIREEDLDSERQALIEQFGESVTGSLEARRTGEYYYTPVFKEVDDVVDGASGTIENAVRFDNLGNGRADGIVLFNLGDGKDTATGYSGKRNTFLGGKGAKNYQGNTLNDTFYLGRGGSATAADFLGSYFDGKAGEDTLIIVATPAEISGYDVDLSTGSVYYRRHENRAEKIATITGIEQVTGHATLNDRMIGNEHNNQLNGQGGVSTLYGMGGNDVLTLEQGFADGGTEEDSYVILQNSCAKNAKIEIIDTGSASAEKNHVILRHYASQIQSITLVKKHRAWVNRRWVNRDNYTLRILLTNNGTTTQLDLEDAYQRSADGTQLQSHHRYSLTTHDGVQIDTSSWPKILNVADKKTVGGVESWSLPVLAAQYVASLDNRKPADRSFNLSREPNAYSLPALKATIAKINTVIGDATQEDWIQGDEDNNQLNGQGGHSKLYGMGGNDILILAEGVADGGTEEDSYIILQNASAENVKIAIIDTGSASAENNHLILKQDAVQIQSITLMIKDKAWVNESWQQRDNYTLRILLTNDNGTTTQLDLEDAYRISEDGRQLKLHNRYSVTTRDGLQIDTRSWPETLSVADKTINENGLHSWSLPVLAAQYVPIYDSKRSAFLASAEAEQSTIELIQKNAQGQSEIRIDGQKTVLPKWMRLQLGDTGYNDTIEGDDSNNALSSVQGNDSLKGKAGSDVYHLYHQPNISKTITIDNEDTSTKPDTDLIILHSVSMDQLNTLTEHPNGDLVLRAATPDIAVGILELRLRHFMQHQRYQHALILDKVGDYYLVEKGEDDRAHIYSAYFDKQSGGFKRGIQQDNLQKQATSGDDWVTLSNAALLPENTFRALAGNDTVIDRSDLAITVYGGEGDDSLVVDRTTKGNKRFYGEAGNDFLAGGAGDDFLDGGVGNDTLRGNQGHDRLEGGAGDDTYLYFLGDGNDVIMDNQGHNTLKLFGDITLDNLRMRVVGDNIHLIFPALDSHGNDDESHFITLSHHGGNSVEIAGQSYTLEALLAGTSLRLEGDERDNRLDGGIGDDVIVGGAGNDTLRGHAGRDKLSGGTGNDVLHGGSGDDELEGGEGDDQLYGEAGNNHLRGDAGNDYLFGHTGNDVLEGGKDDDWLSGGRGDDTYLYSRGDGNDTIKEMGGNDTLRFLGDITVDDIQLKRQGSHLYLLITAQEGKNAGEIQIENHFSLANHRLETLQIAGKAYDIHQLLSAVMDFNAEDTEEIPLSSLLQQSDDPPSRNTLDPLTQAMSSFFDQPTGSSFFGTQAIGSLVEPKQQATISGGLPASSSSLPV